MITQVNPVRISRAGTGRRRFATRLRRARGPVDAVPLVDVALLVFLFFVCGSAFVAHPGFAVRLPEAHSDGGAPHGSLILAVSSEGMIFFQDQRVPRERLRAALARAALARPGVPLLIRADRRVPHGLVVEICDAAANAGFENVFFAVGLPGASEAP